MDAAIIPESALVLVAVLPMQRDLEIAKLLGWYRIPLRSAPKVVDVDYLAFYQTSAFEEGHRCRVELFAEVKGHELTTRRELFREEINHPRANEEYYKIQVGELRVLPAPVMAEQWRRFNFLYTTGERLVSSRKLQELVVTSEERDVLWRALRERGNQTGAYRINAALPEISEEALLAFFTLINKGKQETSNRI
ncbi:MAG: hypothetical protein IT308_01420 [Anaerolineaceae bacterium]|nr:hypothetical protein [Anaerolineaceae bacterium]